MPDTGDFDQGSNSQDQHDQGTHADWAGAFAALPQETPAADGWQRLQSRFPATATREGRRWPLWLATAASLTLVIAIPLRMQSTTATTITIPARSVATPSPDPIPTQLATDAGVDTVSIPIVPTPIENTGMTTPMSSPASTARAREPRRDRHVDPSQRPIRTAARPADTTRIASAGTTDVLASEINLDSLYAQSAQLEGLLGLARDERVSTGTAAALTDTLDAQVAGIDAALSQPEVSLQGRRDLWHDRIDSLRQLVGIETTQRLYSARGQQYEAALVSID